MRTDQRLQGLFDGYNRQFWGGKLQGWSVRWAGGSTGRPHACFVAGKRAREFEEAWGADWRIRLERLEPVAASTDRRRREITVDVVLEGNEQEVRLVLLHEICHAATTKTRKMYAHGSAWRKEVERIIAAGAPASLQKDLEKYR